MPRPSHSPTSSNTRRATMSPAWATSVTIVPGDALGTPTCATEQVVGHDRRVVCGLPGTAHEGRPARVALQATAESAGTRTSSGHHHDVADLGRRPELPAQHARVLDDPTTEA